MTAVIEAASGRVFTAEEFHALAQKCAEVFGGTGGRKLFLLAAAHRAVCLAALQGLMQGGHVVLLCDGKIPAAVLADYAAAYRPDGIILPADYAPPTLDDYAAAPTMDGLHHLARRSGDAATLHPDLALLLATSGSTGSRKMARLSRQNIAANTADILAALGITGDDRAAAHLPLAYSYGFSVTQTHLAAGGSVVLCEDGLTSGAFWEALRRHKVTSLPGVPTHFDIIKRLGLDALDLPALRVLTQAGGRMEPELVRFFAAFMRQRGGKFYAMYGQTEASPRMTVLPCDRAEEKPDSVGLPLAQGRVTIEAGEVIYHGPNVMMGYAETYSDLARGDEMKGWLATGDLGRLDAEGFLFLTGRKKRIAKIDGLRIGLDEIEATAAAIAPVAAFEKNGRLAVLTTGDVEAIQRHIAAHVQLHPSRVLCRRIPEMPLLANGKRDIQALEASLP